MSLGKGSLARFLRMLRWSPWGSPWHTVCGSIVCGIVAAGATPCHGGHRDPINLLWEAVNSDPRVRSARAMVDVRSSEVEGAYSGYYPTVKGTGSMGDLYAADPLVRDGRKKIIGLEVAQPIPVFGREKAMVASATAAQKGEEVAAGRVRQEVLHEMLDTSFHVVSLKQSAQLRGDLERNLQTQVRAIRDAVRDGAARVTELGLAQGRLSQAGALRTNADAEFRATQAKLASLVPGLDPQALLDELRLDRVGLRTPASLEAALTWGADQSAGIRKAEAESERAGAERDLAKAELWPRLTVNAQVQTGSFGGVSAESYGIFLGLNAPLYEGGLRTAAAEGAAHRVIAAQEAVAAEARGLEQRVSELWARWQALLVASVAWDRSVAEQEQSLKLTRVQMASGGATQLDALKAEETLQESRLQAVEQRLDRDRTLLKLLLEIGQLDLAALEGAGG